VREVKRDYAERGPHLFAVVFFVFLPLSLPVGTCFFTCFTEGRKTKRESEKIGRHVHGETAKKERQKRGLFQYNSSTELHVTLSYRPNIMYSVLQTVAEVGGGGG
jgi:hypothetical protein